MALRIQQIACNRENSLVLLSDGSVWASGRNKEGQLGVGTTKDKTTWISVIPSGAIQIAAAYSHSLVLKSDGSVWAAGDNLYGQLGDGTRANKSNWTSVIPSGSNVIQVAAGMYYSLALKADGSVWATGYNFHGQLGDGTFDDRTTWASVMPFGSDVVKILTGNGHSLALKSDGSVSSVGHNRYGQLGFGTETRSNSWKSVMPEGSGVIQISAGASHSLALRADGSVWAAGNNYYGQLGDGTNTHRNGWKSVMAAGSGVIRLAAGWGHSLALKADGAVWVT
jgi:alpha-tubulin suppressor-like RCC1 family protein